MGPTVEILGSQLTQELFDPLGKANRPGNELLKQDLGVFVVANYGQESDTPIRTLQSLVNDAAESGIDEDGLVERARTYGVEELVIPSLSEVTERAHTQAEATLSEAIGDRPKLRMTLVASDHIAQRAYEGKWRRSGGEYYTHPKQAAALMRYVYGQLREEGFQIDDDFEQASESATLLHDATEETIRSCKYFDPDRPESFSPLMVREVFRGTGNKYAKEVANTLRLMTHYAEHKWAPTYPEYISLGSSDFMFCLAKACDIWHNLSIDPKQPRDVADEAKIDAKQDMYRAGLELLSIAAPQRTRDPRYQAWARRFFEILKTTTPVMMDQLTSDFDAFIQEDTVPSPSHAAFN